MQIRAAISVAALGAVKERPTKARSFGRQQYLKALEHGLPGSFLHHQALHDRPAAAMDYRDYFAGSSSAPYGRSYDNTWPSSTYAPALGDDYQTDPNPFESRLRPHLRGCNCRHCVPPAPDRHVSFSGLQPYDHAGSPPPPPPLSTIYSESEGRQDTAEETSTYQESDAETERHERDEPGTFNFTSGNNKIRLVNCTVTMNVTKPAEEEDAPEREVKDVGTQTEDHKEATGDLGFSLIDLEDTKGEDSFSTGQSSGGKKGKDDAVQLDDEAFEFWHGA